MMRAAPAVCLFHGFHFVSFAGGRMSISSQNADLEAMFEHKKLLRTSVRRSLKYMDPNLRSQEDNAIQSIVLESPWFKSCWRLCSYISCKDLREVDTSRLLSEILRDDGNVQAVKKLYVPRIEDKSNMRMLHIARLDDLVPNTMGIFEPSPSDPQGNEREDLLKANVPVDLFLLPGLAFDKFGRRLGRGAGYYDKFLSKYLELVKEKGWRRPLLVALSYSLQVMDEGIIPSTPNDVCIDAYVSPAGVVTIC